MIKVSVIITTFNSGKSIAKALNSVYGQEGIGKEFDLEVILIDDCSNDDTLEIVKKFDIDYLHINSINSGGPNKGRNTGLKVATGDYICFIDHDDTWDSNKVLLQLQASKLAPIITCGYEVTHAFTGSYSIVNRQQTTIKVFAENQTFLKKLSKEKKNLQNTYLSSIMISNSLKNIMFEEHFGMIDYDWLLRIFENRRSVEVPGNLVTRFVNNRNLSLDGEYRKKDYYYSLMSLESYEEKYPRQVHLARKRINGSRARYCYVVGEMKEARKYLLKAMPGFKETLYYVTTFFGDRWIKRRFAVFG